MKAIAHYEDGEVLLVAIRYLRKSGIHACHSGNHRTGYDLLVAQGLEEKAVICLKEVPK